MAFMLAAVALYIPANFLPMMTMVELGTVTSNTIVGGIIYFWKGGAYPIALVILTASIVIPLLKIVAISWLCLAASGKLHPSPAMLGKMYWFTELLGRWSMVDIFVVGILVALVQLGNYMTVTPGPGALAFGGVVVLTMFAAMSFDPRLLWDRLERLELDSTTLKKTDT
jgi:paraquat-inducible protein A